MTEDGAATWRSFGNALPQVPINDLRIHEPTRKLFAATFGRGIYRISLNSIDLDDDGIVNIFDNCIEESNPTQLDSDGDLYGNACDGDFDNDCRVNFSDLALMREAFFSSNAQIDLDGDGIVNFSDLALLKERLFSQVGPSGLTDVCDK